MENHKRILNCPILPYNFPMIYKHRRHLPQNGFIHKGFYFSTDIVGVAPSDMRNYQPNQDGFFSCLDGKLNITWNSVNDDYCDCNDGTDEPGTDACPNSK